ncbi:MAG TPA: hypothetical protein VMG98_02205 [Verrucomicrobiae bacterium]|nr:hypothetical protein [Verrucomicrobiae bacterium]
MDSTSALNALATLTAGLTPVQGATAADLTTVRASLAQSLLRQADNPAQGVRAVAAPTDAENAEFTAMVKAALASSGGGPTPVIVSRTLPATLSGTVATTYGPFADAIGALHWFDIFPPVEQTPIARGSASTPFAVLPIAVPSGPLPKTMTLGSGTLWIAAQLLAGSAPANGYAGIAITGGTATFSTAATASSTGLTIATTTTLTLTVTTQPAGASGSGSPGGDGAAASTSVPATVTFKFTSTGATITAASDASLKAYGQSVALTWSNAAVFYDAQLAQLLVPFTPQSHTFTVSSVVSTTFEPSGASTIDFGAWVIPVTVTTPSQLGAASSAGWMALVLDNLNVTWEGLSASTATLALSILEVATGMVAVFGVLQSTTTIETTIALWKNAAPSTFNSELTLAFPNGERLFYLSIGSFGGATNTELFTCGAIIAANFDRPVAADGTRLGPTVLGTFAFFETATVSEVLVYGVELTGTLTVALALRNALLVTTPAQYLLLAAPFKGTLAQLSSGGLLMSFGVENVLPTLPDPYAANFLPIAKLIERQAASEVVATIVWSATDVRLAFIDPSLALATLGVELLTPTTPQQPSGKIEEQDASWKLSLASLANDAIGSPSPQLFLLDVSSNVDQFGVGLGITPRYIAGDATFASAGGDDAALAIVGLDLVAPCDDLRVVTVPAVAWEPVVTTQNPDVLPSPFPSPAGFGDDGGPTMLGAADVTLVPVAPKPLIRHVISAYDGGAAAAATLTLPFGMIAAVTVEATPSHPSPFYRRPGLAELRPAFVTQTMTGGHQLSLTAADPLVHFSSVTPSLPGAAVQLRNLVDASDTSLDLSVLGPAVDTVFNAEFAPGGASPSVPLTRIDLSGYGASTMSAWTDPTANVPAVVQATMNVLVGRTSHEVVQIKSILYPWGAIVVRTITIDRQDDSTVRRYDSGWIAATAGTFDIAGMTIHPGAVLGAYNIRNIADATQSYTTSSGAELSGVTFDADIQIAGVTSGANGDLVPSTGQAGYVQTAPVGMPLTPSDLAELLSAKGALGGAVVCAITIGGTAQSMRITRVEVANAPHPGASETHEFAAAARGSVVLPQPGNWSLLTRTDDVGSPVPIDPTLGVPLVRQGAAGATTTAPWRLAEEVDLWTPESPSIDYCLLHATDSTRMLFPRPQVANGATAFTSDQTPLLADGSALMASTSICPPQDTCLQFPNAAYALEIGGDGAFTLANVPATFAPSMPSREFATATFGTIAFEYAGPTGTPSAISAAIGPSSWSVNLTGVNVRLDIPPFDGLMRTAGDVNASSASGVAMSNGQLVLGSILQPLEDLMQFLTELGLPNPLALAFSNGGSTSSVTYKLQAGLQFSLPSPLLPALTPLMSTPLGSLQLAVKTGFGNVATSPGALYTSTTQWSYYFTFSGSLQIAVFPGVQAGGLIGLGLTLNFPAGTSPQSEQISFQAGVIMTVGGNIVPGVLTLKASVSFAFMLVVTISASDSIAIGVILTLSATGQILGGLVGITFTATASGIITVTSPQSVTASFSISVDVSLCWFLDIDFTVSAQYTQALP